MHAQSRQLSSLIHLFIHSFTTFLLRVHPCLGLGRIEDTAGNEPDGGSVIWSSQTIGEKTHEQRLQRGKSVSKG